MADSVARHLQDLRVRAGDPSYREIERLIARQGRPNPMARSTIQEKISGKSKATASQVFSLVEALAEHARLNQIQLSPQEIDQTVWHARILKSASQIDRAGWPLGDTQKVRTPTVSWDVEPFRHAGMTDLIEIVERSEGIPVSEWLPHVASEMFQAQMSCSSLMEQAAKESPQEVVQTVSGLNEMFPLPPEKSDDPWGSYSPGNEATAKTLLRFAARIHGVEKTPVIVVALRRSGLEKYVEIYLSYVACWHLAPRIEKVVNHLRSARLDGDARTLLKCVGADRVEDRIVEIVAHFNKPGSIQDRDSILKSMTYASVKRTVAALRWTENAENKEEMQKIIADAVPWGKASEYANTLKAEGFEDIAFSLVTYPEEPPF